MDIRTGQTYSTKADALEAGVPESDITEIINDADIPEVRFSSGPFKGRVYKRSPSNLVRVDQKRLARV